MKRRRHTPEQAVRKVREGERMLGAGSDLTEVLRHLEITESTPLHTARRTNTNPNTHSTWTHKRIPLNSTRSTYLYISAESTVEDSSGPDQQVVRTTPRSA